ncbi:MAG: calcium-binding protein [Rivularia sp. (in: cyanobacteria)]
MTNSEKFPQNFIEVTTGFNLIESNDKPGLNNFGEILRIDANLFKPDDNEKVVATKEAEFKVIAQLGNGEFINSIQETVNFTKGGSFKTQGIFIGIGGGGFLSGETQTFSIINGTGRFKNLRAVEDVTVTNPDFGNLISDITLRNLDIKGTPKDDSLLGTNNPEFIAGKKGNDTINGGLGDDVIEGDQGSDVIRGGAGNDVLAADRVYRFKDKDGSHSELRGDNGNDTIYGGNQTDIIGGGNDNDVLFGKDGDDLIRGGSGFDLLNGGVGNDTLRGQAGIDIADYSDLTFKGISKSVAGVDVNLNNNQAKHSSNHNPLTWTDTLTTIENVQGTKRNDRFIGDSNNNVFYGIGEKSHHETEFIGLDGEAYHVAGDVVEYKGNSSDFQLSEIPIESAFFGGITVTGSGIGEDIINDIEFLKFDDGLFTVDSLIA